MRQISSLNTFSISSFIRAHTERFQAFWQSLTFAQRSYFLACTTYITLAISEVDSTNGFALFIVSTLVLAGLIHEFWPKFLYFWDSLPGKSLIFLFYAFIANFALVQAAGHVNDITGVSSDHFPYTHNLSVLLSLPTWFITTSVGALLLLQLLMPLYILFLLLIKPFGLAKLWQSPCYRFPITTGIARFALSFMLTLNMALFLSSSGLAHGVNLIVSDLVNTVSNKHIAINIDEPSDSTLVTITEEQEAPKINTSSIEIDDINSQETVDEVLSTIKDNTARSERFFQWRQQVLANFIYDQEADSKSRCQLTPDSRVVELNDYEILEIMKHTDTQGSVNYTFTVKPCISPAIGHQFKVTSTK
ncbi:hypothetical protein CWB96_10425 [Pseudoalteromonas citrea]|uniref:Uncharacterized protein n=1 Tax=Pseudoalteromonas citrea TaxID=43655 RepID=A0A5S3XRS7_9GAMM|nr:hypothetical protein [Pseudoalteromonas citrea]TMP39143.1 hypothetical protein CWB97_21035 [Pseudoalteromonas citrea]TMP58974.1 hypothetical protein CWB96_10425 [Pseudoalteromonas citrea]